MPHLRVLFYHALILLWTSTSLAQKGAEEEEFDIRNARATSKPWYANDTHIFGYTIPISPVTVIITIVALWNIYRAMTKASRATGSHILLDDSSDATKKKLEDAKKEIGNDPNKFAKYAREHSACPSKEHGGFLGTWKLGDMDPNFDKAAFDPLQDVNTTIGPVKTHFGYHLIFLTERTLVDI
mmetsp:Transcript_31255/g.47911  ORF Transcript_31255/g.47911 Transcript_31255/m.47911 type:complete len:183 (-) Transcript_31255:276-824(-)